MRPLPLSGDEACDAEYDAQPCRVGGHGVLDGAGGRGSSAPAWANSYRLVRGRVIRGRDSSSLREGFVLLLAVPAEVVDPDTVPVSPSGQASAGLVPAQQPAPRGRGAVDLQVCFLAMTEEAFSQELFVPIEEAERAGHRVRGFGPSGTSLPRAAACCTLAYTLGFTAEAEDAWATGDERLASDFDPFEAEAEAEAGAEEQDEAYASFGDRDDAGGQLAQSLRQAHLEETEGVALGEAEFYNLAESREGVEDTEAEALGGGGRPGGSSVRLGTIPRGARPARVTWLPPTLVPPPSRGRGSALGAAAAAAHALVGGGPPMAEVPAPSRSRGRGKASGAMGFLPASSKAPSLHRASVVGSPRGARMPKATTPKRGNGPAGSSPAPQPAPEVDWAALGDDFDLKSLLVAGVEPHH